MTGAPSIVEHPPRMTLRGLFVLAVVSITLLVGAAFSVFIWVSRSTILERSIERRDEEALHIEQQLSADLDTAKDALEDVERAVRFGTLDPRDREAVEAQLFSTVHNRPSLSDATFTRAGWSGYGSDGAPQLERGDPWQVSVYRRPGAGEVPIDTRRVFLEKGTFVAEVRRRTPDATLRSAIFQREVGEAPNPTRHPTFETTASKPFAGTAIWTDLARSELDAMLPEAERRVTLSIQKAIQDVPGHFAGVVRVGFLASTIDALSGLGVGGEPGDRQFVFLCDPQGRLVSRLDPADTIELSGDDDLRVRARHIDPAVAAALSSARLKELSPEHQVQGDTLDVAGKRYLASYRRLAQAQDWVVAVVVPEAHYTRDLYTLRNRILFTLLIVTGLVLLGGIAMLREVARGLGRITHETARMRRFDFAPSTTKVAFRDVSEVIEGLERAKTAMRALSKYVPVDLVRTLYASNREPALGGELLDVSLMFTDIRGFTDLSERMTPDALAHALGLYLNAMTKAVQDNRGTVDKFIGDAVMAFWNAPSALPDHSRGACAAALACMHATDELYASPEWNDVSPLFTRFGLHRARVMVGHFGAPDRLSYTALGDGVNLASRLEGLCKEYGVAILASEALVRSAGDEFEFRLVDKVAVKGKTEAVRVYELLGRRGARDARKEVVTTYERGLAAYFERDFAGALRELEAIAHDGPSATIVARCRRLIEHPPPEGWDGVYVATSK